MVFLARIHGSKLFGKYTLSKNFGPVNAKFLNLALN